MSKPDESALVEAVLFMATEPLSLKRLAKTIERDEAVTRAALQTLTQRLEAGGLRLAQLDGSYQLVTAPAAALVLGRYLGESARSELSRPALETLAICAYRGPITKAGIEAIRGVSSETMLRNLAARGLIIEAGRADEPGRPIQYTVSHAFLQTIGLTHTEQLPPLPEAQPDTHAH